MPKPLWIASLAGLIAGGTLGALAVTAGADDAPVQHADAPAAPSGEPTPFDPGPHATPEIVLFSAHLEGTLKAMLHPEDEPCAPGTAPCWVGPMDAVASDVPGGCLKRDAGQLLAQQPHLGEDHPYVRVDRAVAAFCADMTAVLEADPHDLVGIERVARAHLPLLNQANMAVITEIHRKR